jgi:hypothetical protein
VELSLRSNTTRARADDDPAVREKDLGGEQIVEGKAEPADQGFIAGAKGEPRHADAAACAGHGREAMRVDRVDCIECARATADPGRAIFKIGVYTAHAGEVNDETAAQRAARPIVPAAAHR